MPKKDFKQTQGYKLAKFIFDRPELGWLRAFEWVALAHKEGIYTRHTCVIEFRRYPKSYQGLVQYRSVERGGHIYASAKLGGAEVDGFSYAPSQEVKQVLSLLPDSVNVNHLIDQAVLDSFARKLSA